MRVLGGFWVLDGIIERWRVQGRIQGEKHGLESASELRNTLKNRE
jgi:hypothetical protein